MNAHSYRARALNAADNLAARAVAKPNGRARGILAGALAVSAILGASAFINHRLAKRAERQNPARGRFIGVRGVRLHVVERGEGQPLVLLHGNGTMVEDFEASGLIDTASSRYRVIAIDRPGFGHSTRTRGTAWTDEAQAEVIAQALTIMGVSDAIVLGHSWGCSVAVALALNHPEKVAALVLASGYYYPSVRADAAASAPLTIPLVADVVRYAISPWLARAAWPMILRKLFGPAPIPAKFDVFPKEMAVRPSQLGASTADSALMVPDAALRSPRYRELKAPVIIIAGEEDRLVDIDDQSGRLHAEVPQSTLHRIAGSGHMVHQTATDAVMAAIDEAAEQKRSKVARPQAQPAWAK